MKHAIHIQQLERRFPVDEYGRPGLHLVEDYETGEWYDYIGLCAEERTHGHLFLASLPGDFSDDTLVGVFGGDTYIATINQTLTTLWWNGELMPAFQEANDYWATENE